MRGPNARRVDSRGRRRRPGGYVRFATIRSFLPRNAGGIRVPRPRCSDMSAPFCRWHLGPWTSRPTLPFPPFLFLSLSLFFFFLHFTALFILPVRGRNEVDEVSLTFSFACERSAVLGESAGLRKMRVS